MTSAGAQLRTLQELNREDTPTYTMTLEVTDTGGLSDSVTIDVTVADENDNLPVITNNPLTADESVLEVHTHTHTHTQRFTRDPSTYLTH